MRIQSFRTLFETYLRPLHLFTTPSNVLQACLKPETTAPDLAAILEKNQAYLHFLQRVASVRLQQSQWSEQEEVDDEESPARMPPRRLINTLGKTGTRNLVLCVSLLKSLGDGLPRTTEDELKIEPQKLIKRALLLEEYCEDHRLANPDLALLSGLLFDWAEAFAEKHSTSPKVMTVWVDHQFKEGRQLAKIAYELSKNVSKFPLSRFAFAGALVLKFGEVLMGLYAQDIVNNPYDAFLKENAKSLDLAPETFDTLIRSQFETTPNELAMMATHLFPGLRRISEAVYYSDRPYFLEDKKEEGFYLAQLLFLAQRLSRFKDPEHALDVLDFLGPTQRAWIKNLKVEDHHLVEAARSGAKP